MSFAIWSRMPLAMAVPSSLVAGMALAVEEENDDGDEEEK
jgi:hypothetical protein